MILDQLTNIESYNGISKNLDTAIAYLLKTDLSEFEVGKYEIDGSDVFVMIQEYDTKAVADGALEAHRDYIDIQYIISGSEFIGYAPINTLETVVEYDASKDAMVLKGKCDLSALTAGTFAIYFPQDGHMPGVNDDTNKVKKAVFKVKVS